MVVKNFVNSDHRHHTNFNVAFDFRKIYTLGTGHCVNYREQDIALIIISGNLGQVSDRIFRFMSFNSGTHFSI